MGRMTTIRSLVRPAVTGALVGAFVLATFRDAEAAELLKDLTLMVVAFWFGQRTSANT